MQNEPTKSEILYGGKSVTVKFKDGSVETVGLQLLDIDHYPALLSAMGDERKSIELYCGKPDGWARGLTVPSHHELITEGQRLNADFFGPWVQRMLARAELSMPGATQNLMQQALQTTLPKSAVRPV